MPGKKEEEHARIGKAEGTARCSDRNGRSLQLQKEQ